MTSIAPSSPQPSTIDHLGARLGSLSVAADSGGYAELEQWVRGFGRVEAFGIEGTGSYGSGLTSFLRRSGHRIVEVNRGDRRGRRQNGKSDTIDAEAAARSVLNGTATAVPKSADGLAEMIRQAKVARDTARKGRTSAIITLKQIVVNAPPELRELLNPLADKALIERCAGFRRGVVETPTASARHTLRALARRWRDLDGDIKDHDSVLEQLTAQASPTLREGFGIGPDCAAELLISSATIPIESNRRQHSPNSAGPARFRIRLASPTSTGSTAAGIARRTRRSMARSSSACVSTDRRSTT
jgi:transposase